MREEARKGDDESENARDVCVRVYERKRERGRKREERGSMKKSETMGKRRRRRKKERERERKRNRYFSTFSIVLYVVCMRYDSRNLIRQRRR